LQVGSIHFAQADAATAINAINQGADLVMISGSLNSFPYSFMAQKEIRKPEDLVGKKIGILAVGGATETATILALKAWNVPRQSVTIFPAGDPVARIVALSTKAIRLKNPTDIEETYQYFANKFSLPTRVSTVGLRNTLELLSQRTAAAKIDMNMNKYLDENTLDELEREGFFKRLAGKN